MSRKNLALIALPAFLLLAACGGDAKPIDEMLRQDLSLASQTNPYQPFVSPIEQGYAYGTYPGAYGAPAQVGGYYPAATRAPAATRTIYRAPASTGTTQQRTRIVKNTKRDAIIGAVAGGAIGAVTSRDRLKGAVIGAAAGGILGAVIGNNVDKKRVPY
jgi:hypothetical protein